MSDQELTNVAIGIFLGLGTYGVVKWVKKEKLTSKGAVGSATIGGIGFPLTEPAVRKLMKEVKNLPSAPVPTSWVRQDEPINVSTANRKKLVGEMHGGMEKKLNGMYQSGRDQTWPVLSGNKWDAVLAPGSVVLIIGERGSGKSASEKNHRLLEVIFLARQRNQIIIFISQETSYVDVTILRGLSSLIVKEPSPLQSRLERPEVREFVERAQVVFNQVPGDKRGWAYLTLSPSRKNGMLRPPKPSFFCDELSTCYGLSPEKVAEKQSSMLSKEDKKERAYEMHTKEKLSIRKIAEQLGASKSTVHNWIQEKKKETSQAFNRLISQFGHMGKN